ncbi:hypothetical protein [Natronomonas sp.]|uniref:hypothetical protein n=1 Tax=Natronomonas sp. TaxID=2184060 RepID=UPI00397549A3
MAFEYANPTISTAYTAHFVHFTPSHLGSNLAVFLFASGAIVVLVGRVGDHWLLVGYLTTLAVVLPVALSFSNLAIPRNSVTYGFSGINMAIVGFLPVATTRYLERKLEHPLDTSLLLTSFFLSMSYVGVVAVPLSTVSVALAAASVVFGSIFAIQFGRSVSEALLSGDTRSNTFDATLLSGVIVWIVLLSVGFPKIDATGDGVTNLYVHFMGYALGFTVSYLVHEWRLLGDRPAKEYEPSSAFETADYRR